MAFSSCLGYDAGVFISNFAPDLFFGFAELILDLFYGLAFVCAIH